MLIADCYTTGVWRRAEAETRWRESRTECSMKVITRSEEEKVKTGRTG